VIPQACLWLHRQGRPQPSTGSIPISGGCIQHYGRVFETHFFSSTVIPNRCPTGSLIWTGSDPEPQCEVFLILPVSVWDSLQKKKCLMWGRKNSQTSTWKKNLFTIIWRMYRLSLLMKILFQVTLLPKFRFWLSDLQTRKLVQIFGPRVKPSSYFWMVLIIKSLMSVRCVCCINCL
jgi:hypothetical protein